MQGAGLHIRRRHLPHWTIIGKTYFITFRTKTRTLTVEEQKLTLEHIKQGQSEFYNLIAAIVMPDHVHVLLTPRIGETLSNIMKGIKGVSARKINDSRQSSGQIWQDESYDRIVRDQAELLQKFYYMLYNPVKKRLTNDPWHYHGWYCNLNEIPSL
jgi:REP element-mobilizing transposase RayT